MIMQDLSAFPPIQLQYLKSFVEEHSKNIEKTIFEADYNSNMKDQAQKYEKLLIKYISLLSEFEPEKAADECSKDFYPINDCLVEVKKKKNKLAEAVLVRRKTDADSLLKSIQIYCSVID